MTCGRRAVEFLLCAKKSPQQSMPTHIRPWQNVLAVLPWRQRKLFRNKYGTYITGCTCCAMSVSRFVAELARHYNTSAIPGLLVWRGASNKKAEA